jgi:hypothetical protein
MGGILNQPIKYQLELYREPFNHVSDLHLSRVRTVIPDAVLDEYILMFVGAEHQALVFGQGQQIGRED